MANTNATEIQQCGVVEVPYDICKESGNYGVPVKGTQLRNGKSIKAILIRCVPEGYGEPCYVDGNLSKSADIYRESYHYVIKADGKVLSDVPEDQTSWALKPYYNIPDCAGDPVFEYPECCKLLWKPIQDTVVGDYPDDVILSIAIEVPSISQSSYVDWAHKSCGCTPALQASFSATQITKLARLLQYLFNKYPTIPQNGDGINTFDNINLCEIQACNCNIQPSEFVCLAKTYCEPIANQVGKNVPIGEVVWLEGYDANLHPVREKLIDFFQRIDIP